MEKKYIYPDVRIDLYLYSETQVLNMSTDIRLKYRGKYYLTRVFKSWEIDRYVGGMALLEYTSQFHAEVYRYQKLMKVDLKMVMPQPMGPDKPVFELDSDQTPEEERINPKI